MPYKKISHRYLGFRNHRQKTAYVIAVNFLYIDQQTDTQRDRWVGGWRDRQTDG
jgi:hypothetical protein